MTALVGRFGSEHMTASWIAMRYMHLSFMPAVGFSVAITSIVGRLIGEGSPEEAQSRVRVTLKIGIVYMSLWGLVFATMNVYFRDTIHWLRSVLLLGMFMTPIFYPASVYPQQFKLVLQLNPMAHLVGVVQELMLNHRFPHPHSLILSVIVSVICLVIGYSIFHHHKDRFSDLV